MGVRRKGNCVYVTDFGLSREYSTRTEETDDLPPKRPPLVGTTRYASIRGHLGQVQSQRDDLESLGYMIIYFIQGRLPWQGLKAHSTSEKYRLVMEKKMTLDPDELCSELP
ncbi:hypothetical protein LTR37_015936 [Vermiconidia calcicola]|uniref:Uncharacterized protein n=1 Tax=Vermiconidia calcicola TaxID=1690605 RepID=A0ACC3MQ88_9PEZI|nr:hypothetical protein LTR37_015936 [Vermiconidia calcicola]